MGSKYERVFPDPVGAVIWNGFYGAFVKALKKAYWQKVGVWIFYASRYL